MSPDLSGVVVFGGIATLVLFIGWRRGFFLFSEKPWDNPIRIFHLLIAFAIYFFASTFLAAAVIQFFPKSLLGNYVAYSSWVNFTLSFLIFCSLFAYLFSLPVPVRQALLRRPGETSPLIQDVWQALYAWILAFPMVQFIGQLLETLVAEISQTVHAPDQLAVQFLKSTFEQPLYFFLGTLTIVVLAPLIEETLFRGFLQSFIRRHLGQKQAILITSVCFSLFHYSAVQGISNFSILPPLFFLSLFLGFLYEKQGSLLAPMALHACFNVISVINIYLFGDFLFGI